MTKKIENLNLNIAGQLANEMDYADEHIFIAMNEKSLGTKHLQIGNPYRVDEGRVLMVTSGWMHIIINLEEYHIEQQTLFVLVPDSIFEIIEWSENFNMQVFSFKDLPVFTSLSNHAVLPLTADKWQLATEYFRLLWRVVHQPPLLLEAVVHLQTAFLLELKRIADNEEILHHKSASRQDILFHRFLDLVKANGLQERKIDFYADKLCITPNYLGDITKQISGLTVMQWLNRHTIQKAKVLLRYSDLPVWEVAELMNFANPSFFSKFFKRETGITPGEYREKQQ